MSKPIVFKHILVPTDFGDPAHHALDVAIAIAEKFGARVTVMHVYVIPAPAYESPIAWPTEQVAAGAQRALDAAVSRARAQGASCEGLLQVGFPPECIVETAKERRADLIVMGTHGRRGLVRALVGSVAERVVRTAPVPVLTVAPEEHASAAAKRALARA